MFLTLCYLVFWIAVIVGVVAVSFGLTYLVRYALTLMKGRWNKC